MEKQAKEIASIYSRLPVVSNKALSISPRKINIVLQNRTVLSNGYVGLGPYRSELMLTPPQNSFRLGLPWLHSLAVHEYRHVQQFNNYNHGIARIAGKILGDDAAAVLNNLAIPNWYWEGDAVWYETELTKTGRGRLPAFFNNFGSIWLAGKDYSFMKLRNGSMKDLIPNHYELGYLITNYGYENYGSEFWDKVNYDASAFKGIFYPFQKAVKKYAGISYRNFVNEAIEYYEKEFLENTGRDSSDIYQKFSGNQSFPQWMNDSSLVYAFNSYSEIPSFRIKNIKSGEEKKIADKFISTDDHFSYANGKIVYAAYRQHIRWGWKDYSELVILDIETGKQNYITNKTRYFSPAFNINADKIVLVNIREDGRQEILISDNSGNVINSFNSDTIAEFAYPAFLNEENIVSVARDDKGRQSIIRFSLNPVSVDFLIPWQLNPIGFIRLEEGDIYFNQTYNNKDRIFVLKNEGRGELLELVNNNRSVYYPDLFANKLTWSVPLISGYKLVVKDTSDLNFRIHKKDFLSENLDKIEAEHLTDIPKRDSLFTIEPYSKLTGLFNFHSLRPYVNEPEYKISLSGENILNTLRSEVSAIYNRNEGFIRGEGNFIYSGFFPQIILGAGYTNSREGLWNNQPVKWNEKSFFSGLQIPLNISRGKFLRRILIREQVHFTSRDFYGNFKDSLIDNQLNYQNFYFSFTNQQRSALQNIYPKFAQSIQIHFRSELQNPHINQLLLNSGWYFPGFARNHSLIVYGAFHIRSENAAPFSNNFPFSRGYTVANFRKMYKAGIDYHFPIAYPDVGFGNILYFLRLRSALFFDHSTAFNESLDNKRYFNSAGIEFYFDTKWWNQVEFPIGIRWSNLLNRNITGNIQNRFELILPVLFN